MAYANLINQTCTAGKAEFFCRIRDFVCKRNGTYADYSATGIGWTLYDSSYAVDEDHPRLNDWFVIFSPGESGRENMYILCKWGTTTGFLFQGYLYWNITTHVGVLDYGVYSYSLTIADTISNPQLWIYGDLDFVFFAEATSTNGQNNAFGKLKSTFESEDIGYCSSSITSGSDRTITVDIDLPADWVVGAGVFIWDMAHIEKVTIKTVNFSAKTITVDVANSYTGTFRISRFLGYVATVAGFNFQTLKNKLNTSSVSIGTYIDIPITSIDQLDNPNRHAMTPMYLSTTGGIYGKIRNMFKVYPAAPLVHKDILIDQEGNEWRYLSIYLSKYIAFKEV